jgi:hypothetical protein
MKTLGWLGRGGGEEAVVNIRAGARRSASPTPAAPFPSVFKPTFHPVHTSFPLLAITTSHLSQQLLPVLVQNQYPSLSAPISHPCTSYLSQHFLSIHIHKHVISYLVSTSFPSLYTTTSHRNQHFLPIPVHNYVLPILVHTPFPSYSAPSAYPCMLETNESYDC